MSEGLNRIVQILKRVTHSSPAPFVQAQFGKVEYYLIHRGLDDTRVVRTRNGPDAFFEILDKYLLPDAQYDVLDGEVVKKVAEMVARQDAEKARAVDNNPVAARHVFWALYHLHMAGSLLTARQHEYVDTIEYELCALVRSRPEDCKGCERRTPNVLLKEPGAEGRCPLCRGEKPPQPTTQEPVAPAEDKTSYALIAETYPGLPIEEAFSQYVDTRARIGMVQTSYTHQLLTGVKTEAARTALVTLLKAEGESKEAARALSAELFKVVNTPETHVPGTQLPTRIALGLIAYQLNFEAGLPPDAKALAGALRKLDIEPERKAAALADIDEVFGAKP